MSDLLNACRHCGYDERIGQHGIVGPAEKASAVIMTCVVPENSEPIACCFVTPREAVQNVTNAILDRIAEGTPSINEVAQRLVRQSDWRSLTTFQQEQRITRAFMERERIERDRYRRAAENARNLAAKERMGLA